MSKKLKRLEARIENLELAVMAIVGLLEDYVARECSESLFRMGEDFFEGSKSLGSKMLEAGHSGEFRTIDKVRLNITSVEGGSGSCR